MIDLRNYIKGFVNIQPIFFLAPLFKPQQIFTLCLITLRNICKYIYN